MKKTGTRKFLRPPWRRPLLTAGGLLLLYLILMLLSGGFGARSDQIGVDLLLCIIGMAFWMLFFVQFALPMKRIKEREEAFYRLVAYILGLAGPAIRIENGEIKERKGEMEKTGPGVVILDTASAGMVRNPAHFITPVGPGVYFTGRYETIAGTVDLHLQRAGIGPQENEDPFVPQIRDESDAAFKARQDRRYATQGLTRDGIQVVPHIRVAVKIDAEANQGNTYFGYDETAVERAIKGLPVELGDRPDGQHHAVNLTWLPLRLAADIWKECVSRYTLEELFAFDPGQDTALQVIMEEMRQRMTAEEYQEADRFGQPAGSRRRSREFSMLQGRGVKVISVTLAFIKLPEPVEKSLIHLWRSSWLTRAQIEREYIERQRSYEAEKGKHSARLLFARRVSHFLGGQSPALRLNGEQILRLLIRGTLQLTRQETYLHRLATDEIDQIKEMQEWSEETEA